MTFRKAKKIFKYPISVMPLAVDKYPDFKKEYWRRYKTISGIT